MKKHKKIHLFFLCATFLLMACSKKEFSDQSDIIPITPTDGVAEIILPEATPTELPALTPAPTTTPEPTPTPGPKLSLIDEMSYEVYILENETYYQFIRTDIGYSVRNKTDEKEICTLDFTFGTIIPDEYINAKPYFSDWNNDGWYDISILYEISYGNMMYSVWIWDTEEQIWEYCTVLDGMPNLSFNKDDGCITSWQRTVKDGVTYDEYDLYGINDLVHIRRIVTSFNSGKDTHNVKIYEYDSKGTEKLFSDEEMTEDEYKDFSESMHPDLNN